MTQRPPQLLWLTDHAHPGRGGMATSCERIVRALRARGFGIDVMHFTTRVADVADGPEDGGRRWCIPVGDDPAHALRLAWGALAAAQDGATGRPREWTHVVAFGGQSPLVAGPVYAAWLGRPLVTLLRGNDFDLGVFSAPRRAVLDGALAASAQVCTVSAEMAKRVAALHPERPVNAIANGIDLAGWQALPSDRAAAQRWRAAQVAPGRQVIGLIGQLKPKKGVLLFLRALLASGLAGRVHLLVVGDIDPAVADMLDAEAARLTFSLAPPVDRYALVAHYLACDWVAIPSYYDGLPNVVLEALALGVPVIASTAGGLPDVVTHGRDGITFAAGDAAGCARAIAAALDHVASARRAMGRAGAARVATHFSADVEAEAYAVLFDPQAKAQGGVVALRRQGQGGGPGPR